MRTLAFGLILALTFTALADEGGSYRFQGTGTRDLAMAGAAHLGEAGLEAIFLQPASLTSVTNWQAGAYLQNFGDGLPIQYGTLAFAMGSGERLALDGHYRGDSELAIGAAFQYLNATLADDSGWSEWSMATVAAWSPMRWFSVGARASYSGGGSEDAQDRAGAFALDFGLRMRFLHPGLEAGVLMKDFWHRMSWTEGSDFRREPSTVLSLAWGGLSLPILPGDWRFEGRSTNHLSETESYGAGLEWTLLEGLATLRGGFMAWRQGEERNYPTFGFGLMNKGYQIDYAYSPDTDGGLSARHRISIIHSGS
jgi:hypothetical protein